MIILNFKFIITTILSIIIFSGCSEKSTYDILQFIQKNKNDREITKEGIISNSEKNPNYQEYKDKIKE